MATKQYIAKESSVQEVLTQLGLTADKATLDMIYNAVGQGVAPSFRKPISMTSVSCTQTKGTVSGTGKGMLFVTYESSSDDYGFSVTVDGVSLGNLAESRNNTVTLIFEFTNSFSVTYKNYGGVTAVFY